MAGQRTTKPVKRNKAAPAGLQSGRRRQADQTPPPADHSPQIDRTDLAILKLLAEEPRLSGRKLALRVGMSPPAVAERIARLERSGVILGYRAEINRAALGYPLVAYIGLVAVQGTNQEEVVRVLATMPEVEDVHVVTGPKDLLVRLRLRDHRHLRDVLFEKIWNVPGVERSETYISLGEMQPKAFDVDLLTRMLKDAPAGRAANSGP